MCPVVVEWEPKPLVTLLYSWYDGSCAVIWSWGENIQRIRMGEKIRVQVKFKYRAAWGGWVRFWVWIDKLVNNTWQPVNDYPYVYSADKDIDDYEWEEVPYECDIDLDHRGFAKFRVRVSMKCDRNVYLHELADVIGSFNENESATSANPRYNYVNGQKTDKMVLLKEFTVYTDYYGDFSLDYVPVTLLYCPPGQDMYSAFKQDQNYGTMTGIGFSETVGTVSGRSSRVKGGMRFDFGFVSERIDAWAGDSAQTRQQIQEAVTDKVTYGYDWSTTLIADNQRVIGRRYWGPLGDIFVLLKNPWFALGGDEAGNVVLRPSEQTEARTEILILPAHKLLRPSGDPIVEQIPWETRRQILELDPFIVNLDKFFKADPNDPTINIADPTVPLEEATNPYIDPSVGREGLSTTGDNRAELIARYSISSGVELDLSKAERITVSSQHSTSSSYYSEVRDTAGGAVDIFFLLPAFGGETENYTGKFVEVSYHDSAEFYIGEVRTAVCKLLRNQNQVDLEDLEIWWDRHFSTFMFRKIRPGTGRVVGVAVGPGAFVDAESGMTVGTGVNGTSGILVELGWVLARYEEVLRKLGIDVPPGLDPDKDPSMVESIAEEIISAGIDLETILSTIDEPPSDVIHRTMTDISGNYAFSNVKAGVYLVQFGNKTSKIMLTEEDAQARRSKRLDLLDVKCIVDVRKPVLWELQQVLGVDVAVAKRLSKALERKINLDEKALAGILADEKISLADLKSKAVLRYHDERVRRGTGMVGGWITDPLSNRVRNCPVFLVNAAVLKREFPEFIEKWPQIDIQQIIDKLPGGSYYRARTNHYGRYILRNVRAGGYHIFCGNKRSALRLTNREIREGVYKRRDLRDVKRTLDVGEASPLELRSIFGISYERARKIKTALQKERTLDETKLGKILEREDLSLKTLKESAIIRFRSK